MYTATSRTNYFAVKDSQAFEDDLKRLIEPGAMIGKGYKLISKEIDGTKVYSVLFTDSEGGIPNTYWEDDGYFGSIDWNGFFTYHLEDDWVAVLMEVGTDEWELFTGKALAFNNKGESLVITLESIYNKAEALGKHITPASEG